MKVDKALTLTHEQLVEAFVESSADELRHWYASLAAAAREGRVSLDDVDRVIAASELAAERINARASRLANILRVITGGKA